MSEAEASKFGLEAKARPRGLHHRLKVLSFQPYFHQRTALHSCTQLFSLQYQRNKLHNRRPSRLDAPTSYQIKICGGRWQSTHFRIIRDKIEVVLAQKWNLCIILSPSVAYFSTNKMSCQPVMCDYNRIRTELKSQSLGKN